MSAFLSELGRKLAEKWLSLLVLPGLLLLGTLVAGGLLGQRHWPDFDRVVRGARSWSGTVQSAGVTMAVLAAVGVLLAASALGVVATAVGWVVRRIWLDEWPRWAGAALVRWRRDRWDRAADRYEARLVDAYRAGELTADGREVLDRLAERRNRICLAPPSRSTWIGDRMAAVDTRVFTEYGLDLGTAWPRLWLTVSDAARAEVKAAATAFDAAATLAGWGVLYVAAGAVWWPAAVAGVVLLGTAWSRGRDTVALYADLVESVVDLYRHDLAEALRVTGPEDRLGTEITSRLRKGA